LAYTTACISCSYLVEKANTAKTCSCLIFKNGRIVLLRHSKWNI